MARPKAKARPSASPRSLTAQLRAAILDAGETPYALGRRAGVDPGLIQRFLDGERDPRLSTCDRLAEALRLKLSDRSGGRGRRRQSAEEVEPEAEP